MVAVATEGERGRKIMCKLRLLLELPSILWCVCDKAGGGEEGKRKQRVTGCLSNGT